MSSLDALGGYKQSELSSLAPWLENSNSRFELRDTGPENLTDIGDSWSLPEGLLYSEGHRSHKILVDDQDECRLSLLSNTLAVG